MFYLITCSTIQQFFLNEYCRNKDTIDCIFCLILFATRGRLLKGRYFMFENVEGQVIVLVPSGLTADMVIVNQESPIKSQGLFLQVRQNITSPTLFLKDLFLLYWVFTGWSLIFYSCCLFNDL